MGKNMPYKNISQHMKVDSQHHKTGGEGFGLFGVCYWGVRYVGIFLEGCFRDGDFWGLEILVVDDR